MAKTHSLIDHIYYENRKDYTHVEGEVAYLDPAPLRRPFEMPRYQRIIALVIVAVAVIIGFLLGSLVGIGTVVMALGMGPLINFFNKHINIPILRRNGLY